MNNGSSWPTDWADREAGVLVLINQRRAAGAVCGSQSFGPAPPLTSHPLVQQAAREHSQDMATQDYFSHTSLDGRSPGDRLHDAGYVCPGWGETIGAGYSSPAAVVNGWMNSPGHCAIIMNPAYKSVGVGYAYDASSTWGHYWTQAFGTC